MAYDSYNQPASPTRSSGRIIPSRFPIEEFRENRTANDEWPGNCMTRPQNIWEEGEYAVRDVASVGITDSLGKLRRCTVWP